MGKKYNIMTSCDDNLAVSLTSIAYNLKDAEIDFYLFHSKVSKQNIEMLDALCVELSKENSEIHFHEIVVPNPEFYDELAKHGGNWPGEAYYSLGAYLLLPGDVDRILYIDAADILIVDDIAPYYNYDFQGKGLIATAAVFKSNEGRPEIFETDDLDVGGDKLLRILRGIFNSGTYVMNLDKMRKEQRKLVDYQHLSEILQKIFCDNTSQIYFGDQGFLSAAFVGDIRYYAYPEIKDLWYMPYNFCLWYYDRKNRKPDYKLAILHFVGPSFKPWKAAYPIFLDRFQKKEDLHSLEGLKDGQSEYFYLWHEYAIITDFILKKLSL